MVSAERVIGLTVCGNTETGQSPTRWTGRGPQSQEPSSKVPSKDRGQRELERYSVSQTWEVTCPDVEGCCGNGCQHQSSARSGGACWLCCGYQKVYTEGIYESVCQRGQGHRNSCVCVNVLWYVSVCACAWCWINVLWCMSVTMSRRVSVTVSRCVSMIVSRHMSMTVSWCVSVSVPQSVSVTVSQHMSVTVSRYVSVTMSQHVSVTMSGYVTMTLLYSVWVRLNMMWCVCTWVCAMVYICTCMHICYGVYIV